MQRKPLVTSVLVCAVVGVIAVGGASAAVASDDPGNRGWETTSKNRGWDHDEPAAPAPAPR